MVIDENKWLSLRKEILKEIKPSDKVDAEVRKIADELINLINEASPKDVQVLLTGSFAKGTYIRGDVDFDIFLLYPDNYTIDELQYKTFEWAKMFLDEWEIAYAQHPYIKGRYKGHEVDIVPSYFLDENTNGDIKIKSAVDRTQLHTKYVLSKITEEQKDDVRIFKKFLKRIGVYGAEIRTGGFSGYLCELLILKYGSFYNLINSTKEWKIPICFDLEEKKSPRLLRTLFKNYPLVVLDPVDNKRNVGSPVNEEALSRLIAASHIFFVNPSTDMFFSSVQIMGEEEIKKEMKERGSNFVVIEFPKPDKSDDILWGELRKTLTSLSDSIKIAEFNIIHQTVEIYGDMCYFLFELEHSIMPKVKVQKGPYVRMGNHLENFIFKNMNNLDLFVRDERLCSIRYRDFYNIDDLINDIKKNPTRHGISKGLLSLISNSDIYYDEKSIKYKTRYVYTMHLKRKFFLGVS
jgi:tRNA nucleotidyltransferase (CCA-adding enzyme)